MTFDSKTASSLAKPKIAQGTSVLIAGQQKPKAYDLSKINVLLVEDSSAMRRLLTSMLRAFGVRDVLTAESGREAQEIISITQSKNRSAKIRLIDLIVTDLVMPDGTGEELILWIRRSQDDEIRFFPIILISAHTTEKMILSARDSGANETLAKPISGGGLAGRILSLIDNPRPFIKAPNFFGPDRRRKAMPFEGQERRITSAESIKVHHERI